MLVLLLLALYAVREPLFSRPLALLLAARLEARLGGTVELAAVRGGWLYDLRLEGLRIEHPSDTKMVESFSCTVLALRYDPWVMLTEGAAAGMEELRLEQADLELRSDPSGGVPPPSPTELTSLIEALPRRVAAARWPRLRIDGRIGHDRFELTDLRIEGNRRRLRATARLSVGTYGPEPLRLDLERTTHGLHASGSGPGVSLDRLAIESPPNEPWSVDGSLMLAGAEVELTAEPADLTLRLPTVDLADISDHLAETAPGLAPLVPARGRVSASLAGSHAEGTWDLYARLDLEDLGDGAGGLRFLALAVGIRPGGIEIEDLAFRTDTALPAFAGGTGRLRWRGDHLEIESFAGELGFEPIRLEGQLALTAKGTNDLHVTGDNLLLTRTHDLSLRADLDCDLTGSWQEPTLGGRAVITDLLYTRPIRLFQFGGEGRVRDGMVQLFGLHGGPLADLQFDLDIASRRRDGSEAAPIRILTELFNGGLSVDLHLGGTGALPRPTGQMRILYGRFALPHATYRVTQGGIAFTESKPFDPTILINAEMRLAGYNVRLIISGSYTDPEQEAVTDPPLPPDQALRLALTGYAGGGSEGVAAVAGPLLGFWARETGRQLLGLEPDAETGLWDRFDFDIGQEELDGDLTTTMRLEYRLAPAWFLYAEQDRYEHYNGGILWRHVFGRPAEAREPGPAQPPPDDGVPWEFTGLATASDLDPGDLRRLVRRERQAFLAHGYSAAACADAAYALESLLRERGHMAAEVDFAMLPSREKPQRVIFSLRAGARFRFGPAAFAGNRHFDDETLHDLLGSSGMFGLQAPPFSAGRLRAWLSRIRRLYLLAGFEDVRVAEDGREVEREAGLVTVRIAIEEGPRYRLRSVRIDLPARAESMRPWLKAGLAFDSGMPYHRRVGVTLTARLRGLLEERGYYAVGLDRRVERADDGDVALVIAVEPGPRHLLRQIEFRGQRRTDENYLRKLFTLHTGDPVRRNALDQAERRLLISGIMRGVTVEVRPVAGSDGRNHDDDGNGDGDEDDGADGDHPPAIRQADVIVTLDEAYNRSLDLHLGWGSYEMLRGGATYRDRNLLGRGRYWELSLDGSLRHYRLASRIRDTDLLAGLFGPDQSLELDGDYEWREEPSFERTAASAGLTFRQGLHEDLRIGTGYRFTTQKAERNQAVVPGAETDGYLYDARLHVSADFDTRDRPLLPTSGLHLRTRVSWSAPELGSDFDFVEYDVAADYRLPFLTDDDGRPRLVLALGGRYVTRDILDQRETLPIQERLFLGGATTVRSFGYNQLGPLDPGGKVIGGLTRGHATVEARIRVWRSWHTALFYDIGVVDSESWQLSSTPGQAIGAGIRWHTPVGPLRVDGAWNPGARFGRDERWAVHAAVGFSF